MVKILIIAGISGSGKNSIMQGILDRYKNCTKLITATTREPRRGEVHGVDYYFITKEEFLQNIKDGKIPEYWHAKDTDRYYGTYLPDLDKKANEGKVIIAQVQAEGIKYLKDHYKTIAIFITVLSESDLISRIRLRQDIQEDELKERISMMQRETLEFKQFCDYTVSNPNGKLNETIDEVINILKKENYVK